ncbi:hypothetical protein [Endozoicomonas acroporae]|uniref:hypothetical protein n=1 Tax=Endozoicomonas acroporae TaxID=1701104 RepID=UPI0013D65D09|nr:hypothetical protein [Endozoicomonas acroporae]
MSQFCARSVIQEVVSGIQRPEGFRQVLKPGFTPNYNGVNSYVEIPEWKPEGDFEIECDVYVTSIGTYKSVIGDSADFSLIGTRESFDYWYFDNQKTTMPLTNGFQHLRFASKDYSQVPSYRRNAKILGAYFSRAGSIAANFKGQISNLRLIDLDNPSNSRYYPGVIYSYVDKNATDVPMPQSAVLMEEWGKGEEIQDQQNPLPSMWSKDGDIYTKTATGWSGLMIADTGRIGDVIKVECTAIHNMKIYGNGSGYVLTPNTPTYLKVGSQCVIDGLNSTDSGWVEGLKVTKVTHGILNNFGTTQPYVPLLGDREEYLGEYSLAPNYLRGLRRDNNHMTSHSTTGRFGSFRGDARNRIPVGSVVSHNGITNVITNEFRDDATITAAWSQEAQHAFQYPNTFKVIKPTDPDYGDYL